MRTSDQLNKVGGCSKNAKSSLQGHTRDQVLAGAQKQVLMRLLKGEQITDIAGEIDSILVEKNFIWENIEQRLENINKFEQRIDRFMASERNREHIFPDGLNTIVDYFGEEIEVRPDFFVVQDDTVEVCKITTSAYINETEDTNKQEMYALGLCAEKLFPDKTVYVSRMHLKPKNESNRSSHFYAKDAHGNYFVPYNSLLHNEVTTFEFTELIKESYKNAYEENKNNVCSPEECMRCSQYNLCHYEPAPIAVNVEASVRPISEIRLSAEQRAAVEFEIGVARANAGPGGGKTLVTAMRIANLLSKGYEPEDFCLLTYTNAGAEEMTARVMNYAASNGIPLDPERFQSGTINSFCQNIIVSHYEQLGYTAPPRVIPEEKRKRIINDLLDKYPRISRWKYGQRSDSAFVNGRNTTSAITMLGRFFSDMKRMQSNNADNIDATLNCYTDISNEKNILMEMYQEYEQILKSFNLLEFDDQLPLVEQLYSMDHTLFENMGYKHILVDEFQDTDLPQIKLLQKMIDTSCFKSFMAVGDDSQAIFGFRHTSPEFMINFEQYFGRFTDFSLVENHRSTSNIVDFANLVSAQSKNRVDKDLIATKPAGPVPKIEGYYSSKQEVESIAMDIARRWNEGERDIAVLMSERSELHVMAGALTRYGIPSVLMCRIPFVQNSRVAALQTFYDAFNGNGNQGFADYQNVLLDGTLAGATAEQINSTIESMTESVMSTDRSLSTFMEFANALDKDKSDPCYQEFLEKLEFCRSLDELDEFWQEFKIYGQSSEYKREGKYEGVCLNTIHSAKGLEWDTTYLSLSKLDKLALHKVRSSDKDETIRKFFVGVTRARENLIMTGEYVLRMDKNGVVLNDYVKMAYDLCGKPFPYNYAEYRAVREHEKQEALDKAMNIYTTVSPTTENKGAGVADALNRYRQRVVNRSQEQNEANTNRTINTPAYSAPTIAHRVSARTSSPQPRSNDIEYSF